MVGLIEDELDALFFHECLGLLTLVNLAVVQEDIPLLTSSLESGIHHLLQLPQELDEDVLSSSFLGLSE